MSILIRAVVRNHPKHITEELDFKDKKELNEFINSDRNWYHYTVIFYKEIEENDK